MDRVADGPDADEHQQADAARQAVQPVRQVDGVGGRHDQEAGQGDGHEGRQEHVRGQQGAQGAHLQAAENDHAQGRQDLPQELDIVAQVDHVVQKAEDHDHGRTGDEGPPETAHGRPEEHRQQDADGHGNPAHPRDGVQVHLAIARHVHGVVAQGRRLEQRDQRHRDEQGQE